MPVTVASLVNRTVAVDSDDTYITLTLPYMSPDKCAMRVDDAEPSKMSKKSLSAWVCSFCSVTSTC